MLHLQTVGTNPDNNKVTISIPVFASAFSCCINQDFFPTSSLLVIGVHGWNYNFIDTVYNHQIVQSGFFNLVFLEKVNRMGMAGIAVCMVDVLLCQYSEWMLTGDWLVFVGIVFMLLAVVCESLFTCELEKTYPRGLQPGYFQLAFLRDW